MSDEDRETWEEEGLRRTLDTPLRPRKEIGLTPMKAKGQKKQGSPKVQPES